MQAGDADYGPARFRKGSVPTEAFPLRGAAERNQGVFGTGVIVEAIGCETQEKDGKQQHDGGKAMPENPTVPGARAYHGRLPSYAIVRQVPEF
jgi:hypothetical protein